MSQTTIGMTITTQPPMTPPAMGPAGTDELLPSWCGLDEALDESRDCCWHAVVIPAAPDEAW